MDPTCGLGEKLRDIVLNVIWDHLLYLICYGQNVEQLKEELVRLTNERSSIQLRIDEARNNVEQIVDTVLHWLDEVNMISEQAEQLHKESQSKRECTITSCPNPWLRYKLSKRAKAMTQQIADINGRANFSIVAIRVPPPLMLELPTGVNNEWIDSRVQIKRQIIEALLDPSVNMVGLCGLGGVGKTTIAKDVVKEEEIQKKFGKVIMATVSQEMNIGNIQDQIIEKLGMERNEIIEEVKASLLYKRLKKEKNMLLILDDLWDKLDLRKVGIPLVETKDEGCKILFTSRNEELLSNYMKCQEIVKIGVLSEDEALELFKKIAKLSTDSSSPELMPIATKIVQMFGGLPLAIATSAKALRKKNINEWKDALVRLKKLSRNITGFKEVDIALRLSYNRLSPENKRIFLLAAMLSHDPSIENLLMYSVGLDILKHAGNMEEAHNGISTVVSKLKSLNLFLDSSTSSHHFTIHDVFRDVALSIASDELFYVFTVRHRRLNEWPDENQLEGCMGIFLQDNDITDLPEELYSPALEFFLLNNSKKVDLAIPKMFFKSSNKLKLLAFTNVHFSSLPSIRFLQKLKALCLHSCVLEDITEVGSLKKLKVLSLAHSKIQQLPIELAKLTSLQMLNLSYCYKLKVIPQKLLSSLKKLEVLYMRNSFNQWNDEQIKANKNTSVNELRDLPIFSLDIHIPNVSVLPDDLFLHMKLERYKILIGNHRTWSEVNDDISKILILEIKSSIHFTSGIRKLMEGVEYLYLYGSTWDGQLSHNSLNNLKTFTLRCCGFVKLVPFHVLKSLNNLEELNIGSCDMLEALFDFRDWTGSEKFAPSSMVVPLKKLKLWRLPKLMNVWSNMNHYQGNVSVPSLRSIHVSECRSLQSIFPASVAKDMLGDLEELRLEKCDMDVIVAEDQDFESVDQDFESVAVKFDFPRLTSLKLHCLQKLRNFYPQAHTLKCPNLQSLHVEYCDELKIFGEEVFVSSTIYGGTISKYPLLSHVNDKVIDKLEKLILGGDEVAGMIESGRFPMYHFPKVKFLDLNTWEETSVSLRSLLESFPKLEDLRFSGSFTVAFGVYDPSKKKKAFGGDEVAPSLKLTLDRNDMISLSPSPVSFPNITHLYLTQCYYLTYLMTSSTARSLVRLTRLSISDCNKIEEIIRKQEGEDDEGKEIIFSKLKFLVLIGLPRLKRFCCHNYTFKFLFLDHIIIKCCPKFKVFSPGINHTPCLRSIQLSKDNSSGYVEILDTNLDKTFYQQRFVASRKLVLDEHDASMLLHDQFPADHCPQVDFLCIERFVEGWVTFPYTLLERFPKLNAVHVENCSFEEIFPSHKDINDQILVFKELCLAKLDRLQNIFPSSTSLDNLTVLKVSKCHQLVYLMTNSTAKNLVNLETLEIKDCEKLVEIVAEETNDFKLPPVFQKLKFFQVKSCSLVKLAPFSASLDSLTMLKVSKCHQLVYLVTNSAAKSMVNLETLEIDDCEKLKEIVRKKTNKDVEGEILFHGLKILKLTYLPTLKTTDNRKDFNTEDRAAKTGCTNISTSLFNHNKISLQNLEKLEVEFCDQLEMVFGYEDLNNYYKEKQGSSSVVVPLNLTHLQVSRCEGLTTLMTSSIARSLVHLTHLSVRCCDQMQEIITKEEEGDDEDKEILFAEMEFLELDDLLRLKSFCGNNYTFKFPLLKQVAITECPHLTMFCPGDIHAPRLHSIRAQHKDIWKTTLNNTIQHLFTFQEVISTTKSMALNAKNITTAMDLLIQVTKLYVASFKDEGVTFPYRSLDRFPMMEHLYVEHSSFEEIFPSPKEVLDIDIRMSRLQRLYIAYLDKLKSIWKDNIRLLPIRQNLRVLEVKSCCNLAKLAPSSASFQNLLQLSISGCHQLIHLVTISTAKSLVSLSTLKIHDCKKMEEIVMNETNEDAKGGITFEGLREIELTYMPSLKMLSSQTHSFEFPTLQKIKITGCPEMKILCLGVLKTPKLSKVKVEEHDITWEDEGDLNNIIKGLS